jgi:predicted acetyltransferase
MGFGYGQKYYNYSFRPDSLPKINDTSSIKYINGEDLPLLADCYLRYSENQHGFCKRSCFELKEFRKKFEKEGTVVGFKKNGHVDGYLYFTSKKCQEDNFLRHKLVIKEWIYNSLDAFNALAGFIHIQKDQYDFVEYDTQKEDFYYVLKDIRKSELKVSPNIAHKFADSGIGLMYRIVNVEMFLTKILSKYELNCPDMEIALAIEDSFRNLNQKIYKINIRNNKLCLVDEQKSPIQINMNISEFSSLMVGSAKLGNLFNLGKIKCNKKDISNLECFFNHSKYPECITKF